MSTAIIGGLMCVSTFHKLKERFDLSISYKCWLKDRHTPIEQSDTLIEQSHYFQLSIMARYKNKKKSNGKLFGKILWIMGKIWSTSGSSLAIITYSVSWIGNLNANSILQDQILRVFLFIFIHKKFKKC